MIDLEEIEAARRRIADLLRFTPTIDPDTLSQRCGAKIHLKLETLQETGSFKPRGALNRILTLSPDDGARGVVAASAGNHAQGVAFAAGKCGIEAHIVMPTQTPLVKVTRTRELGARVELFGRNLDEALERAHELEKKEGLVFVHPFEDREIMAGQGTVGLEILDQVADLDAVVVPIGGGGLISGIATAIKTTRPEIEILGVQSESAPSMKTSLEAGERRMIDLEPTIAEGIALKRPGANTFPIIQRLVDEIALVSEAEIEDAVYELLASAKTLTEGAGAAGYAAVRNGRFRQLAGKTVAVVLCGANIDMNVLDRIIERSLLRQHRLVRLRITISDRPGGLARLLDLIATHEANVLHIQQQRVFTEAAFWQVDAELILETRNRDHVDELIAALRKAGYTDFVELDRRIVPAPRSVKLSGSDK